MYVVKNVSGSRRTPARLLFDRRPIPNDVGKQLPARACSNRPFNRNDCRPPERTRTRFGNRGPSTPKKIEIVPRHGTIRRSERAVRFDDGNLFLGRPRCLPPSGRAQRRGTIITIVRQNNSTGMNGREWVVPYTENVDVKRKRPRTNDSSRRSRAPVSDTDDSSSKRDSSFVPTSVVTCRPYVVVADYRSEYFPVKRETRN